MPIDPVKKPPQTEPAEPRLVALTRLVLPIWSQNAETLAVLETALLATLAEHAAELHNLPAWITSDPMFRKLKAATAGKQARE